MSLGFGSVVVGFRRSRGWSQKRLALEADLDQSYLAGIESGRRPPPRDAVVKRLTNALKLSPEESQGFQRTLVVARAVRVVERVDSNLGQVLALLISAVQYCSAEELQALATLVGGYRLRENAQSREETDATPVLPSLTSR